MQFKWNYKPPTPEEKEAAEELAVKIGTSPILAMLLIRRGITTESAAKRFFRPQLADLIDPFLMKDMDVAVDRLNDAMGRKERILVYGDYDVDGCTAVALVYKFLQQFYSNIDYYIPNRYDKDDGFGITKAGLEYAQETGAKLVIVLDIGIKEHDRILAAKNLGIDFIICDHHQVHYEEKNGQYHFTLPDAVAVLDPKRPDDPYPFKELCACGIGFKFMQAFAKNNGIPFSRLIPLLDFCAVSIAADIVPVMDYDKEREINPPVQENRILAFHGLKQLNINPSIGLKAIIDICGLSGREISMSDIVFKIGPRINASGRIMDKKEDTNASNKEMRGGRESVDLLIERDFPTALRKARQINQYNELRKEEDKIMTDEANQIVSKLESQKHQSSIVLYNEHWKKGIIGIVASRLAETYYRPTVVLTRDLTRDENLAVGTARSAAGFNIYAAVEHCRELLENFGGHTYAAGLTMKWENVKKFKAMFQKYVEEHIQPNQKEAILNVDAQIDFRDIKSKRLYNDLKRFAPFGLGNEKPLFCTVGVYDFGTSKVVGREQEHIKLELVDSKSSHVMNGIAFGQSAAARYIKSKRSFDIVYTIEENIYKHGSVQLQIEDIREAEDEVPTQ